MKRYNPIGVLALVTGIVGMLGLISVMAESDQRLHMNGNEVDYCVRYSADNNSGLEGHFFININVALPLRSPSLGLKWDHEIADEDVMGLPYYDEFKPLFRLL